MTEDAVAVLRNVPLDPRPRVLGRAPALDPVPDSAPPPATASAEAAPMGARLAAAMDEGLRRGREEGRREAAAAFDAERAAQVCALAAARGDAEAALRAADAARLAGNEAARQGVLARAATTSDLRRSIDGTLAAAREALLDDAVLLAYEATARFVGDAATADDATMRRERLRALVAHAAATALGGRALLHIRLHPDDLALLGDGPTTSWQAVADASVEPGGCRLETTHGGVDARLTTLFDQLRAAWSHGGCRP